MLYFCTTYYDTELVLICSVTSPLVAGLTIVLSIIGTTILAGLYFNIFPNPIVNPSSLIVNLPNYEIVSNFSIEIGIRVDTLAIILEKDLQN
jgi:hypothetical protein